MLLGQTDRRGPGKGEVISSARGSMSGSGGGRGGGGGALCYPECVSAC